MEALRLKTRVPALQEFYDGGPFVVSFDGSMIACICGDTIKILNSTTKSSITSAPHGYPESPKALSLSPCNRFLYTSASREIHAWEVSTLTRSKNVWKGTKGTVTCMECHPSGKWLATGGDDRKVLIFNVDCDSGTHCKKILVHGAIVSCVMFHPDPDKLLLFSRSSAGGEVAETKVKLRLRENEEDCE